MNSIDLFTYLINKLDSHSRKIKSIKHIPIDINTDNFSYAESSRRSLINFYTELEEDLKQAAFAIKSLINEVNCAFKNNKKEIEVLKQNQEYLIAENESLKLKLLPFTQINFNTNYNKMSNNRTNPSGKSNYMYGKHHTEKTKDKIRRANNGQNSGENNPAYGKRGNELRTPIVQFTKDKQLIEIYESISGAERITNISHVHIISVCRNQRKTAGGYYWRYLYDQTCKDGTIIPCAITLGLITEEEALRMLEEQKETEGEN